MARPDENPLFQELLWVHSMIRRDLEVVQALARDTESGAVAAEGVHERIAALRTGGPLFQLKYGCLHYCRFVESHHSLEDRAVFPAVERADPELGPTLEKLIADHRVVAEELAAVEEAAALLEGPDEAAARTRLVSALDRLAGHLLEHLELEERSLEPALARMSSWAG